MSVKLTYSICTLGDINFWAIPKCGNTTIKYLMLERYGLAITEKLDDETYRWVHSESKMRYITPEEANSNGKVNFTFIRDKVDRFISLHKDFCIRRKEIPEIYGLSPDELLEYLLNNSNERNLNIHCRSINYFLEQFNGAVYRIEDYEHKKLNSIDKATIITPELRERIVNNLWLNDDKWFAKTQPIENFEKWL